MPEKEIRPFFSPLRGDHDLQAINQQGEWEGTDISFLENAAKKLNVQIGSGFELNISIPDVWSQTEIFVARLIRFSPFHVSLIIISPIKAALTLIFDKIYL